MKIIAAAAGAVLTIAALAACSGTPVDNLSVGDCFNETAIAQQETSDALISSVPTVDCSEPHDAEVYSVFDVAGITDYDAAAIDEQAISGCLDGFEPYVGVSYEDAATLDVYYLQPSPETWELGDREVICSVVSLEGQTTGSVKDSAA